MGPSNEHEVTIDGAHYVRATDVTPTVDTFMQALWESYMGPGDRWNDGTNAKHLWMGVNEDGEGDSFEQIAALVTKIAARDENIAREYAKGQNDE